MAGRVEDKVAIVTGAASGIGRGTAEVLAREGARVVLADVNEELGREAAKAIGGDAVFVGHDVSSEDSWRAVIDATLARFGRLDVLVNNAGIIIVADVESTTVEQWRKVMAVNAEGVFLGCKHAIPVMRRSGGGSIINISSTAGMVGTPPFAAYSASKGAVRILTKTVAAHCREKGDAIRCNSIHPGGIDTPLVRAITRQPKQSGISDIEELRAPGSAIGYGQPTDIGYLVLYLASDESRFMTGSELAIDGGLTAV
jgi:3(or 17)beta-hydroxysteroid dehydrogenase